MAGLVPLWEGQLVDVRHDVDHAVQVQRTATTEDHSGPTQSDHRKVVGWHVGKREDATALPDHDVLERQELQHTRREARIARLLGGDTPCMLLHEGYEPILLRGTSFWYSIPINNPIFCISYHNWGDRRTMSAYPQAPIRRPPRAALSTRGRRSPETGM